MTIPIIGTLKKGFDDVVSALAGQVQVNNGGGTLWLGTTPASEAWVTIATGIEAVSGFISIKSGSNLDTSNFFLTPGDTVSDSYITIELTAGNVFRIKSINATANECVMNFTSYPFLGGGIMGPQGAQGENWGDWQTDITFQSGYVEGASLPEYTRYRLSSQNCQVQAHIAPSTSWGGGVVAIVMPSAARPSASVRCLAFDGSQNLSNVIIGTGGGCTFYGISGSTATFRLNLIYPLD